MKLMVATWLSLVASCYSFESFGASCVNELRPGSTALSLIECMQDMDRELRNARDQVSDLKRSLNEAQLKGIPPGSILAFDLREGCPLGWGPFSEANGRTIIGANMHNDSSRLGSSVPRQFRELGGSEVHVLTVNELPSHSHPILRTDQKGGDGNFVNWHSMGSPNNKSTGQGTSNVGGSRPHNNMPPFIALYLCKKSPEATTPGQP